MKALLNPCTLLFLALTVLCSGCAKDAIDVFGSISGVVKDAQQQPIEGVSVSINPKGVIKSTGKDGSYSFVSLESKEYTLTYAKDEYITVSKTTTVQPAINNVLDVHLDKEPIVPILTVSTQALDFESELATLTLEIINTGKGALNWSIDYSPSWFTCSPLVGTTATGGKSSVTITASRSQQVNGIYKGNFSITSNGGKCEVAVAMTVPAADQPTVSMEPPREVTSNSATFRGMIESVGKDRVTSHGFCWSTTPNPAIDNTHSDFGDCATPKEFKSEVTGLQLGMTYYVRAYAQNSVGVSYSDERTFKTSSSVLVTSVSLNQTSLNKTAGDSPVTLTATISPSNATDKNVSWSSSNPSVATVDNGVVNFVGAGNATITVTTQDGNKTASCYVTVAAATIPVTSVSLNQTSLNKNVGDSPVTLYATIYPNNASNQNVNWSTGNSSVATVYNGTVSFTGVGSTYITVTTQDGNKTATCNVTVTAISSGIGGTTGLLTWSIDSDGTLTISGTGWMPDYTSDSYPWNQYRTNIKTANIQNGVTSIGEHTFYQCINLTSITIPNSVTTIGLGAFSGCNRLTSITIPNSVTSIEYCTFYGCSSLTSITIPNSVTTIGSSAFYECNSLTSITIGNSVTAIGDLAFYQCSSLTSISIPNSVTTIGNRAFESCSGLTSITIGNSVTTIGNRAFYDCSNLTSITIPNTVTTIGDWAFSYCSSLTSITIGNSVTTIGLGAFQSCSGLTSITIGNSVTTIGVQAFSGCSSLTSVTIPNSVTTIGNSAFSVCNSLRNVTVLRTTPPSIGNYNFSHASSATLTVPKGCKAAYQSANGWKDFGTIVELEN
jgi:uncharacterized protein YjdB